jgi:hypothetical protein
MPLLTRVAALALLAAAAAAGALGGVFALRPGLTFDMASDPPGRVLAGFYPAEAASQENFAWTAGRAQVILPDLDRRAVWTCTLRFKGARPPGVAQPRVDMSVDGQPGGSATATNDYQELAVPVPARPQRGLRLVLTSSEVFVPGPSDSRRLGVQVDSLACLPEGGHPMPPAGTFADAAMIGGLFGALVAVTTPSLWTAAACVLGLALLQALPLASQLGPYTAYPDRMLWAAVWILVPAIAAIAWLRARRSGDPGGMPLGFALTGTALFLKLLGLLHPSKATIDALFHAHRFDDVLAGRYFFTQVMPGGVQFPYSIALYVFASPWAAFTRDHIALLRVVVAAAEAAAGLLLYWAILRTWKDRRAAAWGLVFYHLVPVSYWIASNANLTNGFGQSAALAAMSLLIVWPLRMRQWWEILGLATVAATALLSHVSTFALLGAIMSLTAVVYAWRGGREMFPVVRSIVLALAVAIAAAVVLYYGRPEFFDAYRSVSAARSEAPAPVQDTEAGDGRLAEGAIPVMTLPARIGAAVGLAGDAIGWPILALGLLGLWQAFQDRARDRLVWAVTAWAVASGVFFLFGIVAPGGVGHQRQAMEFISRAVYAGSPAAVVLAAYGCRWAWDAGAPLRAAAGISLGLALFNAGRMWMGWWR